MGIVFSNFLKSSVLVVGDIMLDRYWHGCTNKISPESPVPIVEINRVVDRPGGAANVAMNITAIGGQSRLIGLTGMDKEAQILKIQLKKSKVLWSPISIHTHSTIVKLRIMSRNQQLIRLDFEKTFNDIDTSQLLNQVKKYLLKYKVLVLSDYLKGSLSQIEDIISLAKFSNIPIIIDPKGIEFSRYTGATILTPNILEFETVAGFCRNEETLINRAKEMLIDYNLEALLITRSEQGMTLFRKNKSPLYFSTQSKEVYDVTGAGDTVIGVLSAALSSGKNLEQACFLANAAAGLVIKKIGTSTIDTFKIKNIVQNYEYSKIPFGVLDELALKKIVSLVKDRGEKIVMTNGVFDILHYGHISYLSDAKKLGDKLIVAVNSDESTRHLKGETRPINTLEQRMLILSALSMVDWVVPFYEDTPIRLIKEISPDFLVKGGDYNIQNIEGNKEVSDRGGKVCVLNFQEDYSSSKIIDIIKTKK